MLSLSPPANAFLSLSDIGILGQRAVPCTAGWLGAPQPQSAGCQQGSLPPPPHTDTQKDSRH